jgi:hypothetical protein
MSFTADRLLLFGATGDLAQRMLLPSLCALDADRLVAEDLLVICTARSQRDDADYRGMAGEALEKYLPDHRKAAIPAFLERLSYQPLDANDTSHFGALAEKVGSIDNGLAIFLSTAPSLFEPTIAGLAGFALARGAARRLVARAVCPTFPIENHCPPPRTAQNRTTPPAGRGGRRRATREARRGQAHRHGFLSAVNNHWNSAATEWRTPKGLRLAAPRLAGSAAHTVSPGPNQHRPAHRAVHSKLLMR